MPKIKDKRSTECIVLTVTTREQHTVTVNMWETEQITCSIRTSNPSTYFPD